MTSVDAMVDSTDLRTLTNYLRLENSEFKAIMFVRSPDLLGPTAELISNGSARNQAEFQERLRDGRICLSRNDLDKEVDEVLRVPRAAIVNLNRVPGTTACQVIAVPPVFVAYAKGLDLTPSIDRLKTVLATEFAAPKFRIRR